MTKYIIQADTKEGVVYYMNAICLTEQIECAASFFNKEKAEQTAEYFKNFFHYETPKISVIEISRNDIKNSC